MIVAPQLPGSVEAIVGASSPFLLADGSEAVAPAGDRRLEYLVSAPGPCGKSPTLVDDSRVEYVDVAFTNRSAKAILDTIAARDPEAPFAYIVTPNVDHVVRLQNRRSDLWPAYRAAWMTLCDSRVLARLARRVGFALPVVPGSDLTLHMFEEVVKPQDCVAIVGGTPEQIADLAGQYGLGNVKHYNPPMGFIGNPVEVAKTLRFLIDARARYIFLAVGSPQQEILAYRAMRSGGLNGIGLCIGASLNFLIGVEERAPAIMQNMGLEWLFRLSANPQRMWRRYLVDGPLIFPIAQRWRRKVMKRHRDRG